MKIEADQRLKVHASAPDNRLVLARKALTPILHGAHLTLREFTARSLTYVVSATDGAPIRLDVGSMAKGASLLAAAANGARDVTMLISVVRGRLELELALVAGV